MGTRRTGGTLGKPATVKQCFETAFCNSETEEIQSFSESRPRVGWFSSALALLSLRKNGGLLVVYNERGNVTNNENKATRELQSRRINPESNWSSADSRGKIWFSWIFRLLRDAAFSESDFWSRRRCTISKYSNTKHVWKICKEWHRGWSFFFLSCWLECYFFICYISIFCGEGGGSC